MIDNIGSKIENLRLQECSLKALLRVVYFTRNIYETEIVTSGLYYIEDLIILENYIV